MLNIEDATTALLTKWVFKAVEPGIPNFHLMLRFRLANFQPVKQGGWCASMEFFTLPSHLARRGSKTWDQVTASWAKMLPEVKFIESQCFEEFLSCSV